MYLGFGVLSKPNLLNPPRSNLLDESAMVQAYLIDPLWVKPLDP